MIRRLLVEPDRKELPQRERIGQTPRDAAFAVQSFEEADHHDAEILARRQRRTPQFIVIEVGAAGLAETIETGVVQNLVEPLIEGMTGCRRQLAAVPQVLLSLSLLPRPHRHSSIVRSKHFQCYMFLDFRHGLLGDGIARPSNRICIAEHLCVES